MAFATIVVAGMAIVMATFYNAYSAVDEVATINQQDSVGDAVAGMAWRFERELRLQAVWDDAYENTTAHPDTGWMADSFGSYLSNLLGFAEVYVLDAGDKAIFGYESGVADSGAGYAPDAAALAGLVDAVRGRGQGPHPKVSTAQVHLADGTLLTYRGTADIRIINGRPMDAVVATILPDTAPSAPVSATANPALLVALMPFSGPTVDELGRSIGVSDIRWLAPGERAGSSSLDHSIVIHSADGTAVGTLAWRAPLPANMVLKTMSWQFVLAGILLVGVILLLIVLFRRQLSQVLRSREREARLARTDHLTGLGNRLAMSEEIVARVETLPPGQSLGVLTLDLDRFKSLNDLFGHLAGDDALKLVGGLLTAEFPDCLTVRLGGDEFAMLVPSAGDERIAAVAARVVALLDTPLSLGHGDPFVVSGSVGYAVAPRDGTTEVELLRHADLALYAAKHQGRGRAVAYDPEMVARQLRKVRLEEGLRRALENDAIQVYFQPLLASDGSSVLGVEALARWTDPELGVVSPVEFIPLAEETGLIVPLGEQVLRKALSIGRRWSDLTISVNVSSRQVQRVDMVATVRRILEETGFPAARLEIELTESILVADDARADAQIRGLQEMGVKVALDDFGTGYASLLYLRQFGFDKLKIDRQFVIDTATSVEARAMVMAIVEMARSLDLSITAEGVETAAQANFLRVAGCDRLQGFHFSPPLPAEQFDFYVEGHRAAA